MRPLLYKRKICLPGRPEFFISGNEKIRNKFMSRLKTITISGSHAKVGKTMLAERLFKRLKGWSGLKVTVMHNGICPTGKNCGVCNKLDSEFSIVSDNDKLMERGKDTYRLKSSGAK